MKHFNLIYDEVKYGEGIELENGAAIVEFDHQHVEQFANIAQVTGKYYAYSIEWIKSIDDQLDELRKLVQQMLSTMPRTYSYHFPIPSSYTWNVATNANAAMESINKANTEAVKRNTITALANALKNIYLDGHITVNRGSDWLAAELYEQGIIVNNEQAGEDNAS